PCRPMPESSDVFNGTRPARENPLCVRGLDVIAWRDSAARRTTAVSGSGRVLPGLTSTPATRRTTQLWGEKASVDPLSDCVARSMTHWRGIHRSASPLCPAVRCGPAPGGFDVTQRQPGQGQKPALYRWFRLHHGQL